MVSIFVALYLLFFLGISAVALFVIYHFLRYSLSPLRGLWSTSIFLLGFFLLVAINATAFIISLRTLDENPWILPLPVSENHTPSPW